MASIISNAIKYTRLVLDLRDFLQNTTTLEQSKQVITARIRDRQKNFLSLVQRVIYQNPRSPYLKLLRLAGSEFGDIEILVNQEGVESTLHKLRCAGVYLSYEEFKRDSEIVRGSQHFHFKPSDFDNPLFPIYYQKASSGSRSSGTRTTFDLKNQADIGYYMLPMLVVNDSLNVPIGLWKPILPASSGIGLSLRFYKVTKPIARWFTPIDERHVHASLRDKLALKYIIYGSRLWGARLSKPEYVSLEDAARVAYWMAETKKQFGGCCLISSVSPVVKLSHAAIQNGIDISNTHFIVSGEPLTDAKRQQIEATGAKVTPRYTMSEIGNLGCGCLDCSATDEVHFFHDTTALIQHEKRIKIADYEISVNAFLCTTLLASAPRILLNVESDDYGVMENRSCGCLFGQLGFNTHLHDIRSYAKLTGTGMTIISTDFIRILEEVLPRRYGGSAADYQLIEDEDSRGQTHLNLIISPDVGALDKQAVLATVIDELQHIPNPSAGRLAAAVWSQANTMNVIRTYPKTHGGKVMTLELRKIE